MDWDYLKKFDNYKLILGAIIVAAVVIRLYYFFQYGGQALWYDEADYVLRAKTIAFPELTDTAFAARKPVFMVFIWSIIYKLGGGEVLIKLLALTISSVSIYFIYLLGKEAHSKDAGLILATLLAVYNLHVFFSFRIMLDEPALLASIIAALYFIKWYKERKTIDMVVAGAATGLAIQIFYIPLYLVSVFFVFLLLTHRHKIFHDKQVWMALLGLFLAVLPWLIWGYAVYGDPFYGFNEYKGTSHALDTQENGIIAFYEVIPNTLFVPLFLVFLFGLGKVLLDLYLNFKDILMRKTKDYDIDIFFLIWIIILPVALGIEIIHVEPRYMMPAFVPTFYFIASGLVFIKKSIRTYSKPIAVLALVLFLLYASYTQVAYAGTLIESRSTSFEQERYAGIWLKDNLDRSESFMTCNQEAVLESYAGRQGHAFGQKIDRAEKIIEEESPKYLVINGYFGDCAYSYPNDNPELFELVQVFFIDENQQQPIILIYEVQY